MSTGILYSWQSDCHSRSEDLTVTLFNSDKFKLSFAEVDFSPFSLELPLQNKKRKSSSTIHFGSQIEKQEVGVQYSCWTSTSNLKSRSPFSTANPKSKFHKGWSGTMKCRAAENGDQDPNSTLLLLCVCIYEWVCAYICMLRVSILFVCLHQGSQCELHACQHKFAWKWVQCDCTDVHITQVYI